MKNDDDLKPCPFCGEAAVYEFTYGSFGHHPDRIAVTCSKDCVKTAPQDCEKWTEKKGQVSCHKEARETVKSTWNRRQ